MADGATTGRARADVRSPLARVRPFIRALHRDLGYLAVGLTVVYAASGLAVNHITDFRDGDASYVNTTRTVALGPAPAPTGDDAADDRALAALALARLGVTEAPRDVSRVGDGLVDVTLDGRTVHVDARAGRVEEEGRRPRFFLRAANYLHLNRGKRAWTTFADAYAVGLLALALSGLLMIPGRKGLVGRGAVLAGVGAAIPIAYLALAGQG